MNIEGIRKAIEDMTDTNNLLRLRIAELEALIRKVNRKLFLYADSYYECPTCTAKKLLSEAIKAFPQIEAPAEEKP